MNGAAVSVQVAASVGQFQAAAWDALGDGNPFVSHAFLSALEDSGCVGRRTGWLPVHVALERDGERIGFCPCYLKSHSQGEYVFDHSWADAYQRAGGRYYPKLLGAVPFTPATGPRFLVKPVTQESLQGLSGAAQDANGGGLDGPGSALRSGRMTRAW